MDIEKLEENLAKLRGLDFEAAEAQERAAGNNAAEMSLSKSFQARLAAMAMGVPAADVKELPLKEYNRVCITVFNFLFGTSDTETLSAK